MKHCFLKGLPATGPEPVHLHMGRPTPWSEGVVVEFTDLSGSTWVFNAQPGSAYPSRFVMEWSEAGWSLLVVDGAVYLVRLKAPDNWRFCVDYATDCIISDDGRQAFVVTYCDLVALDVEGDVSWKTCLATDGIEIAAINEDSVIGRYCWDPPDRWSAFHIDRSNGSLKEELMLKTHQPTRGSYLPAVTQELWSNLLSWFRRG